jgi:fluoride exporter
VTGWAQLASVAVGAAFGGVARYIVTVWFTQRFGPGFPFGTLFINVSGSFLIGVVVELSQTRVLGMPSLLRLLLATGVLGGYTTFSTFSYDALVLGAEGSRGLALAYAAGSVVLGILAAYAGIVLVRIAARA